MKTQNRFYSILILILTMGVFLGCTSSKVKILNTWTGDTESVAKFKTKNVLVIARTADNDARIEFEEKITEALKGIGVKATESFKKVPKIYPNKKITEERVKLIKNLMKSEGYTAVVITVIKDQQETTTTSDTSAYVGAYGNYYPGYYGNFYNYYSSPYAYGSYYNSFGGYIPTGTTTHTSVTYVLETAAYNLDEPSENQLVAVISSDISDPKKAHKIAKIYVEKIINKLN